MKSLSLLLIAVFATASLTACGSKKPPKPVEAEVSEDVSPDTNQEEEPPPPETTFDKLGKREGLTAVVDSFVSNATLDPTVKSLFSKWKGDRLEELKAILVDHFCKATGGDCTPAEVSGTPAKVNDKQFDALKVDFAAAMEEHGVAEPLQAELTSALEALREPLAILLNQKP